MTEPRSDEKQIVRPGALPVLAWTLAWGVMGAGLYLSGVLNKPRTGPLWAALLGGAIPWALAGAFTFPGRDLSGRPRFAGALIWALAYLLSFGSVAFLTVTLQDSFFMLILLWVGWALGPGAGAFASAWLLADAPSPKRSILMGVIWMLGFLAGTGIGFFGIYAGPELAKIYLGGQIGMVPALTLGFSLGTALGGLVAAGIALALTRLARRFL